VIFHIPTENIISRAEDSRNKNESMVLGWCFLPNKVVLSCQLKCDTKCMLTVCVETGF
jgi:hypothetical protein